MDIQCLHIQAPLKTLLYRVCSEVSSPSSGSSTTQARRLFYDIVVTFVLHSSIVLYSTMFLHSDQDPAWHTYRHVDKVVVSFLFRVNVNKIPWHVSEARLHFLLS